MLFIYIHLKYIFNVTENLFRLVSLFIIISVFTISKHKYSTMNDMNELCPNTEPYIKG